MQQSGRYDFPDGGSYCGEWVDCKFQGLGICSGPLGRGRYSGKWLNGYEICGVYSWPNGHSYEGYWSSGKRHGLGIENKDKWVYKGEWTRGLKGRYGGRYSKASKACYEGTWSTGLQDGYGVETYADGGTYQGQWFQGMRHGHGVRESVAYDQAVHFKPHLKFQKPQARNKSVDSSVSSLYSDSDGQKCDLARRDRRLEHGRGGFVLEQTVSNKDGVSLGGYSSRSGDEASVEKNRGLGENITRTLVRTLKLKRKGPNNKSLPQSTTSSPNRGTIGSVRSLASASSCRSDRTESQTSFVVQNIDGNVTEVYAGEWKNDKRCGFGTCSRSDGLKYEGEWYNNKKSGCGMTTYQDGWVEEGKYKDNVLVTALANKKSSIFAIKMARLRDQLDSAVSEARKAAQIAVHKTEVALNRQKMVKMKLESVKEASEQAKLFSAGAHQVSATCCNSQITDSSLVDPNLLQNTSLSVYSAQKNDSNSDATKSKESTTSSFKQIFNSSLKRSFSRSKNSNSHSDKSKSTSFREKKNEYALNSRPASPFSDSTKNDFDLQTISSMSPENRSTSIRQQTSPSNSADLGNAQGYFQIFNLPQNSSSTAQQVDTRQQRYITQQQLQQHIFQQQLLQYQQQPNLFQTQNTQQQVISHPSNLQQQQRFSNQQSFQKQLQQPNNSVQNTEKQHQPSRSIQPQVVERSRLKRNKDPFDVFIGSPIQPTSKPMNPSSSNTFSSNLTSNKAPNSSVNQPSIMNWLKAQLSWFLLVLTNSLFALIILWFLQRSLV